MVVDAWLATEVTVRRLEASLQVLSVKKSDRRSEILPKGKAMGASAPKLPTAIHPQPEGGASAFDWGILAFCRKSKSPR